MLIIGERINGTRKGIKAALEARDEQAIRREAREQAESGADYIDVNGGTTPEAELENMLWLARVVQDEVALPLAIDSASPGVIAAGLTAHRPGAHRPFVNSISMERGRCEDVLPLVKQYNARVVALAMDDEGIPRTAADRLRVVERIVETVTRAGVPLADVYVDPLVMALSADPGAGKMVIDMIKGIGERWPELHTTCGLSNISFGLPDRALLNRTFLALLMAHGLSSAILDPLDPRLMAVARASTALLGHDDYCMEYIRAFRAGKLPAS